MSNKIKRIFAFWKITRPFIPSLVCSFTTQSLVSDVSFEEKKNVLLRRAGVKGFHFSESVTVAVGRDRKIRTEQRTNQIAGFITVPS